MSRLLWNCKLLSEFFEFFWALELQILLCRWNRVAYTTFEVNCLIHDEKKHSADSQ